ncbi:hypothetical protein ACS0TY_036236 [Phlomoides rotata]
MAAYAALVSVMHIIDKIEHHPRPPISLDKLQVESLTEKIAFLQEFLQGYESMLSTAVKQMPWRCASLMQLMRPFLILYPRTLARYTYLVQTATLQVLSSMLGELLARPRIRPARWRADPILE